MTRRGAADLRHMEQDQLMSALANSVPGIVWSANAEGEHDYCNEQWTDYTGLSIALSNPEAWLEAVHPEDRAAIGERWSHCVATGQLYEGEYRLRRHDGVYRWHLARGRPQRDTTGRIRRWFGTANDVEDLHVTNAALRQMQEDLQRQAHLLGAVQQAIIATDTEGIVVSWNAFAEKLYGWAAGDAIGQRVLGLLIPEADRADAEASLRDVVAGRVVTDERAVRRKDGAIIWVAFSAAPMLGVDGRVTQIVGVSTDITERKLLESQLLDAQKMEAIGRLAGGIAHDFNNLLTIISAHAAFAAEDVPDAGAARGDLEIVQDAAMRAARLTRQLLAFSRRQVLEKHAVDLNTTVGEIEQLVARFIGEDVRVILDRAPEVPVVHVNPGQLDQALLNLVINARDAMPDGGELLIRTRTLDITALAARRINGGVGAGRYAAVSVTDTGTGMDRETKEKIFEPFFTTKEPGRGTGLGLATVYGLAKQSGGFVTVVSAPGEGATFSIALPQADQWSVASPDAYDRSASRHATGTLLLVEDEDAVREVARRMLTRSGFEVVEARDGVHAMGLLRERSGAFDLVITDAVMPLMSGPELIRHLRTDYPYMPAVLVSGYADDGLVWGGLDPADIVFLAKPYRSQALIRVVSEVLRKAGPCPGGRNHVA